MTAAIRVSLLLGTLCLAGCANGSNGLSRAWGYDLDVSLPQPVEATASPAYHTDDATELTPDPFLGSAESVADECSRACF